MKKMVWFCVIGMVCGIFIKSTVQGTDEEKEVSYRQLTSVRMETVSDDKTKLIISLNGRIKYHCFKITKPLRLVIELTNTLHNWEQKEIEDTGDSLIKRVRSAQFQNEPIKISRVVLDLKDKVSYKSELDDITNQLVVTLTREAKKTAKKKIAKISPKKKKIKERTTKKTAKKEEGVFPSISKQIVSLDFNEAEIRDVLRILAVKSGVNIVYGDDVSGTVTIHLDDVPFDDAVSMILKIRGLVIQKVSGNIFRVITPELLSEERNKAVTFTKIFTLNYGTAEDIKTQLAEMKGSNSQTIIGTDTRTNKLIVTAIPEVLENFERLIKNLDVKPSQVLIEAKIMKVRRSDVGGLGVDWSFTKTLSDVGSDRTDVMGEAVAPGKSIMEGGSVVDLSGQPVTSATGAGTGVALPVLGGGVVTFGSVSDRMAINLALSAMQDKGKSKVLACPKVATLNNEEARILIGQKVPFVTTRVDASGIATQTTEFIDVGTRLVVTPTININKMITLKIKPEKSTVDEWRDAGPVISTQEVETTVLIKDGETIVIAGLIDDRDINQNTKVPFLGDIPLLGYLFKKKTWDKERDELLIFLTPRIMYE